MSRAPAIPAVRILEILKIFRILRVSRILRTNLFPEVSFSFCPCQIKSSSTLQISWKIQKLHNPIPDISSTNSEIKQKYHFVAAKNINEDGKALKKGSTGCFWPKINSRQKRMKTSFQNMTLCDLQSFLPQVLQDQAFPEKKRDKHKIYIFLGRNPYCKIYSWKMIFCYLCLFL